MYYIFLKYIYNWVCILYLFIHYYNAFSFHTTFLVVFFFFTNQLQIVYKAQFNRFRSKATGAPSHYVKHVEGNSYKCLCISEGGGEGVGRGRGVAGAAYWKLLPTAAVNPLGILSLCCLTECLLHVAQLPACSLSATHAYYWFFPLFLFSLLLLCSLFPASFHACLPVLLACCLSLPLPPCLLLLLFTLLALLQPTCLSLHCSPPQSCHNCQEVANIYGSNVTRGSWEATLLAVSHSLESVSVSMSMGHGVWIPFDSIRFVSSFPYLFTACSLPRHDVACTRAPRGCCCHFDWQNIVAEVPRAPPLHGCHWQHTW